MPIPNESEIYSRVEAFASELVALVRASAVEVVGETLAGIVGSLGGPSSSRNGRRASRPSARAKGAKRDPAVLAALTDKLEAFIKKNPGKRIEEIGQALGTPTKELVLPVRKLVAAKKVSTKGKKRATKYFSG